MFFLLFQGHSLPCKMWLRTGTLLGNLDLPELITSSIYCLNWWTWCLSSRRMYVKFGKTMKPLESLLSFLPASSSCVQITNRPDFNPRFSGIWNADVRPTSFTHFIFFYLTDYGLMIRCSFKCNLPIILHLFLIRDALCSSFFFILSTKEQLELILDISIVIWVWKAREAVEWARLGEIWWKTHVPLNIK